VSHLHPFASKPYSGQTVECRTCGAVIGFIKLGTANIIPVDIQIKNGKYHMQARKLSDIPKNPHLYIASRHNCNKTFDAQLDTLVRNGIRTQRIIDAQELLHKLPSLITREKAKPHPNHRLIKTLEAQLAESKWAEVKPQTIY
jgi:hypothetical protein